MKYLKLLSPLLFASTLALTACGGGGSGSNDSTASGTAGSSSASTNIQDAATITEADAAIGESENSPEEASSELTPVAPSLPSEQVSSTSELVSNDSFLFKSNYEVDVRVRVAEAFDALTVCQLNSSRLPELTPDYSRCVLRANLDSGEYSGSLLLTNDTEDLVLSLWDFQQPDVPQVSYWNLAVNGELISL